MQRQQKLLLSFMVWGFVLLYGTAVATALTSQEIEIAKGSTVFLEGKDAYGNYIGYGSGFIIHDGQIATNYHVIKDMSIGFAKLVGKTNKYRVKVLAVDKKCDLAIVKVTGIDAPALPLGDSDAVQDIDKVYVVGNPQGLEGTVSAGIISAIRSPGYVRSESGGYMPCKMLQIDASISPGSSGGPVLNDSGEVIGIAVAGYDVGRLNLNFAIPVNYLKRLANIPITPTPVKPKPVKPQVDPPPVEPEPVKPKVDPPPVESKSTKPQVSPPKPEPPKLGPRPVILDKGIKLYEQARYNEAIEVLNSVIQEIENPIHQAEAYLYLGGSKRGSGASNDKVKEEFQKTIRHNPNQELPPRVGEDHPIFAELIEEVRKELTGELTVISLLPQTEIWIHGTGTDRKMLGTGRVRSRLLRGNYIVEGIYGGRFQRKKKTVTIEPDRHEVLYLGPNVEHDSPSSISVGETIPLTLNLISSIGPQQVKIYYKIYDKDHSKLKQNNQGIRLWDQQSASSTWIYSVGLPPQKRIGSIEYYIEIEYDNHVAFRYPRAQSRYYQISILDGKPPTISVLSPRDGERFTVGDQTTVRAQVIDNSVVEEVRIYFLAPNDRSQKLFEEGSPGMYAIDITLSRVGFVEYYLTATDEAGNESQSKSRHIDIRLEAPPVPPDDDNVEHDQSGEPTESGISEESDQPLIPEDKPPTINLLYPPEGARFTVNQQITIRAEITDNTAVKEVLVHFLSGNSRKLFEGGSSGMYAMDISFSRAGSVEYYLTATDEAGNESQSESRWIEIEEPEEEDPAPLYQRIWVSVAADDASISGSDGSYMLRLAYLREGKTHPTLGAQLDFSPDRTNMSAMFQWGPALGESDVAFTLLGGIAAYEDSLRSTHITPILGAGLRFYPRDKIVIDATSSIQFRQGFDTISLYHYEVGIRFYITRELGLRAGYGKLSLGDEDVTTLQIGLGVNF